MAEAGRLYWSAFATSQLLEMKTGEQDRVSDCVEMIRQFPLIGVRLIAPGDEHRRRFVCGGFRIVYSLAEHGDDVMIRQSVNTRAEESGQIVEITIRRFAPA
ncbi:MAG: hypothetical protein ACYCW5_05130 [Thermoleophilia bacterium]